MNIKDVKIIEETNEEFLRNFHESLKITLKQNEMPSPNSIRQNIRLDVHCQLENGEKVIFEMRAFPQSGDTLENGHRGLKNRDAFYLSRVHSASVDTGPEGERPSDFYANVPNTYLVDICNFLVFEKPANINMSHSKVIATLEQIKQNKPYSTIEIVNNINQGIDIINKHAELIKKDPSFHLINTASLRFPGGYLFNHSLNITIIELPKVNALLDIPVADLTAIQSILLYIYIAHDKKYEIKIHQLMAKYKEIELMDRNLHKVVRTNTEAINAIMLDMGRLDYLNELAYRQKLLDDNTAEVTAKVRAEVTAEKAMAIAKNFISSGVDLKTISKCTGLSLDELENLKNS
jgi:hypothetical protein